MAVPCHGRETATGPSVLLSVHLQLCGPHRSTHGVLRTVQACVSVSCLLMCDIPWSSCWNAAIINKHHQGSASTPAALCSIQQQHTCAALCVQAGGLPQQLGLSQWRPLGGRARHRPAALRISAVAHAEHQRWGGTPLAVCGRSRLNVACGASGQQWTSLGGCGDRRRHAGSHATHAMSSNSNGRGGYYREEEFAEGLDSYFDDDDYFFREGLLAYETRLDPLGEVCLWSFDSTTSSTW